MKYKEVGWRAIYKNLCVFPKCAATEKALENFPGAEDADCILTYGYIDHEAGLSLAVLAAGIHKGDKYQFFDGNETIASIIRIDAVEDEEFYIIDSEELKEKHAGKLSSLDHYAVSDEVEKTREMSFLDSSRDLYCIDDVLVFLLKDGLEPEGCWTRIIAFDGQSFAGTLLNEPDQDFGYHNGENIGFFVQEMDDGKMVCILL